tara:strand:- start:1221 stop:3314 length:2094 start_codon:yes stop_codon:yes gene_type:complete
MSLIKPINRWTEKEGNVVRVYTKANPHYYQDITGSLHPIDLSHSQSLNNSNVGNFTLKSKNVHSLGVRQDSNQEKYIGIRPDETQENGSQQLEWSIISANINNTNIPIDLSKNQFVDNNQVNLGNVKLFSTRKFVRQMVYYTGSIDDFKVNYKLHLTGLQISNSKYTGNTNVRNSISCSLIDCGNISGSQYSSMVNLQTHSESILSMYFTDDTMIKNPNFNPNPYYNYGDDLDEPQMMSGSEFVGDSGSFYMIDRDDTFWGCDASWDMQSSGYLKDNLYLKFKDYNLGERINNYILNLINAEMDGSYIRIKGGKKVGYFGGPPDKNMALLLLTLDDITHISSSFRYKDFDDFSHVPSYSYSDIITKIKTQLSSSNAITSSTSYYEPNNNNHFVIKDDDDNDKYIISPPVLLDSDLEKVTNDTVHTLKDNGDGTYEYTKYPSKDLYLGGITGSVNYIDAETVYATATGDGFVNSSYSHWNTVHPATTGNTVDYSSAHFRIHDYAISLGKTIQHILRRGFLYFDTSGLSGTVSSVNLVTTVHPTWNSGSQLNSQYHLVKSTAASTLSVDSYNDFEGWRAGANAGFNGGTSADDDLTDYTTQQDWKNFDDNDVITTTLNSASINDVSTSPFRIAMLQKADFQNYLGNGNNGSSQGMYLYSTDQTGTSNDPYLSITLRWDTPRIKILSGQTKILSGNTIIK